MHKQIEIGARVTALPESPAYLPFKARVTRVYNELVYLVDHRNRNRSHVLMSWEFAKYYEDAEVEANQEFKDKAELILKRQNQAWIKKN